MTDEVSNPNSLIEDVDPMTAAFSAVAAVEVDEESGGCVEPVEVAAAYCCLTSIVGAS
jgi:hypothetical protein